MVPPGSDGHDGMDNSESNSDLAEPTVASSTSVENSPDTQHPNFSRKERPCKGRRVRYRRFVEAMVSQIEADPAIFDMDDMELNLPALVNNNPWLKQKFMRRMENFKQKSLAERNFCIMPWPQPMYAPAMVELQDGFNKAFAEHSTREEEPLNSLFEPMKVFVGNQHFKEQRLVIETDKVATQLRVLHGEGYDTPATVVMIPRIEEIRLPIKILSNRPTNTIASA